MTELDVQLLIAHLNTTDNDIRDLRIEMGSLRREIRKLNEFRWTIYGGAAVLSLIFSVVTTLIIGKFT